jgi:hypothetical protein
VKAEDIDKLQKAIELRGYVVAEWYPGKKPGDMAPSMTRNFSDPLDQPFVVLCETTEEDFLEQQRLIGDTYQPAGRTLDWVFYRFGTD